MFVCICVCECERIGMHSEIKPHPSHSSLQLPCMLLWVESQVLLCACLVWIPLFAHLSGFECSKQKAGRLGQRASMLVEKYTQMLFCVKLSFCLDELLQKKKKKSTTHYFFLSHFTLVTTPSLGPRTFRLGQLLIHSTAQAWAPRGPLCQLPFGWLAALSGISGKRDLREFEPVWVKEGGEGEMD